MLRAAPAGVSSTAPVLVCVGDFFEHQQIADVTGKVLAQASERVCGVFSDGVVGDCGERIPTKAGRAGDFRQRDTPMFVLRFARQEHLEVVAHNFHLPMMNEYA
jgi:hypothetical protein